MAVSRITYIRLRGWGAWSRTGLGVPRCKTQMASIQAQMMPEARPGDMTISDDVAMTIDGAVASLRSRNPQMANILLHYYRASEPSIRGTAQALGLGKSKVASLLATAEAWVEGYLDRDEYAGVV